MSKKKENWNKLYEKKDPRCYDEVVANKGIVPNLDPWKFGGLTKEPIEVFFSRLWVERNAKTAYRSFGGDTDSAPNKPKGEPTVSDEETMKNIRELEAEKAKGEQQHVGWMAPENNEVLVKLLTPIFYNDRDAVIAFLNDINGLKDEEVADIIQAIHSFYSTK